MSDDKKYDDFNDFIQKKSNTKSNIIIELRFLFMVFFLVK